ncbi:hypothetical protein N7501_004588 [Penicillium viridicatum]|nr:hypothetical protein N7501_004588 [Penicillium viridicatum]
MFIYTPYKPEIQHHGCLIDDPENGSKRDTCSKRFRTGIASSSTPPQHTTAAHHRSTPSCLPVHIIDGR